MIPQAPSPTASETANRPAHPPKFIVFPLRTGSGSFSVYNHWIVGEQYLNLHDNLQLVKFEKFMMTDQTSVYYMWIRYGASCKLNPALITI